MTFDKYKKEIASFLQCDLDNIFLYWKGRVALYAFLKSLNLDEGDEVIIPAFTCVVVPNAIIYLGLKPVYVDISPQTYNIDVSLIEKAITDRTRVIICQNTFGLSSNIDVILAIAKKYNLFTLEDCTHGFGGYYKGKPNGSYCDAAFYSTQWNKPFSTGIGGFLLVNNNLLIDNVRALENDKIKPTLIEQAILFFLLLFRQFVVNRYTQSLLVKFYRLLSTNNLVVGSNEGSELNTAIIPKNYFKDISIVQVFTGVRRVKKIKHLNQLRNKNAIDYTSFLKSNNRTHIDESLSENHLYLKYPVIVKDRQRFFEIAIKNKITIGDWFLSPLHPIVGNLDKWGFSKECFPKASEISQKIVNLPTDIKNNTIVLKFLEDNLNLIE